MLAPNTTLRPGYLVSLRTTVTGNIKYDRTELEGEYLTSDGRKKERWETEKTIFDPTEHEAATKARGRARTVVSSVCAVSAHHGLLCPTANLDKLESAIKEAREIADQFNNTAKLSRLAVYVVTGKIGDGDVEAVKAINSEVRGLLEMMEQGVKNLDVAVIRDAARRAKGLGSMLTDSAKENIQVAIDAARGAARKIVKAGEMASQEVDLAVARKIAASRTAFLDLDDASEMVAPQAEARTIELDVAEAMPAPIAKVARVPRLELD